MHFYAYFEKQRRACEAARELCERLPSLRVAGVSRRMLPDRSEETSLLLGPLDVREARTTPAQSGNPGQNFRFLVSKAAESAFVPARGVTLLVEAGDAVTAACARGMLEKSGASGVFESGDGSPPGIQTPPSLK